MNKSEIRHWVLVLLLIVPLFAWGEENAVQHRLTFKSGRVVVGEVIQRTEDVVVVKDAYGARFQYPMSDVVEISEVVEEQKQQTTQSDEKASRSVSNIKRTSLGFHVAGGVMSLDGTTGGAVAADFLLGANNVGGRRIFLGGEVGYRALIASGRTLSVIPINAVMELPLMQGDHVPMIGAHIGYGIGVNKSMRGGVNAGLALAYRYHFSRTGSLYIGVEAEVQQFAKFTHTETVETGQEFTSGEGRTAVLGMVTLGILF